MAGNRNPFDERNYLYLEQMRLVKELKPKISIIENVKGFMSMKLVEKEDHLEEKVQDEVEECGRQGSTTTGPVHM